jgi:hypothetical protein
MIAAGGVIVGALIGLFVIGRIGVLGVWVFAGVAASVLYGRFR